MIELLNSKLDEGLYEDFQSFCLQDRSTESVRKQMENKIYEWVEMSDKAWDKRTHIPELMQTGQGPSETKIYHQLLVNTLLTLQSVREDITEIVLQNDEPVIRSVTNKIHFSVIFHFLENLNSLDYQQSRSKIYEICMKSMICVWKYSRTNRSSEINNNNNNDIGLNTNITEFFYDKIRDSIALEDIPILTFLLMDIYKNSGNARIYSCVQRMLHHHIHSKTHTDKIDMIQISLKVLGAITESLRIWKNELKVLSNSSSSSSSSSLTNDNIEYLGFYMHDQDILQLILNLKIPEYFASYIAHLCSTSEYFSEKSIQLFQSISAGIIELSKVLKNTNRYLSLELLIKIILNCYNVCSELQFAEKQTSDIFPTSELFVREIFSEFDDRVAYCVWNHLSEGVRSNSKLVQLVEMIFRKAMNPGLNVTKKVYLLTSAVLGAAFVVDFQCDQAIEIFIQSLLLDDMKKYLPLVNGLNKLMSKFPNILNVIFKKILADQITLMIFVENFSCIEIYGQNIGEWHLLVAMEWITGNYNNPFFSSFALQFFTSFTLSHFQNKFCQDIRLNHILAWMIVIMLRQENITPSTKSSLCKILYQTRLNRTEFDADQNHVDCSNFDNDEFKHSQCQEVLKKLNQNISDLVQKLVSLDFVNEFSKIIMIFQSRKDLIQSLPYLYYEHALMLYNPMNQTLSDQILDPIKMLFDSNCLVATAIALNRTLARIPNVDHLISDEKISSIIDVYSKLEHVDALKAVKIGVMRSFQMKNNPHVLTFWINLMFRNPNVKSQKFLELINFVCRLISYHQDIQGHFERLIEKSAVDGPRNILIRGLVKDPYPYIYDIGTLAKFPHFSLHWMNAEQEYENKTKLIEKLMKFNSSSYEKLEGKYSQLISANYHKYPHYLSRTNIFSRLKLIIQGNRHPFFIYCFLDCLSCILRDHYFMHELYASDTFHTKATALRDCMHDSSIKNTDPSLTSSYETHNPDLQFQIESFLNKSLVINYEPFRWLKSEYSDLSILSYFFLHNLEHPLNNIQFYDPCPEMDFTTSKPTEYVKQKFETFKVLSLPNKNNNLALLKQIYLTGYAEPTSIFIQLRFCMQEFQNLVNVSEKNIQIATRISDEMIKVLNLLPYLYGHNSFDWRTPELTPIIKVEENFPNIARKEMINQSYNKLKNQMKLIDYDIQTVIDMIGTLTIICNHCMIMRAEIVGVICEMAHYMLQVLFKSLTKGIYHLFLSCLELFSNYCSRHNCIRFFTMLRHFVFSGTNYFVVCGSFLSFAILPDIYCEFLNLFIKNAQLIEKENTFTKMVKSICLNEQNSRNLIKYYVECEDDATFFKILDQLLTIFLICNTINYEDHCERIANVLVSFLGIFMNECPNMLMLSTVLKSFYTEAFNRSKSLSKLTVFWRKAVKLFVHTDPLYVVVIDTKMTMDKKENIMDLHLGSHLLILFVTLSKLQTQHSLLTHFSHIHPYILEICYSLVNSENTESFNLFIDLMYTWLNSTKYNLSSDELHSAESFYLNTCTYLNKLSLLYPYSAQFIQDLYTNAPSVIFNKRNFQNFSDTFLWNQVILDQNLINIMISKWIPEHHYWQIVIILSNIIPVNVSEMISDLIYNITWLLTNLCISPISQTCDSKRLFTNSLLIIKNIKNVEPLTFQQFASLCTLISTNPSALVTFHQDSNGKYSSLFLLVECFRYWMGLSFPTVLEHDDKTKGIIQYPVASIFYKSIIKACNLLLKENTLPNELESIVSVVISDLHVNCMMADKILPLNPLKSLDLLYTSENVGFLYWTEILNELQEISENDTALQKFIDVFSECLSSKADNQYCCACIITSLVCTNSVLLENAVSWTIKLLNGATTGLIQHYILNKHKFDEDYDPYLEISQIFQSKIFIIVKSDPSKFWLHSNDSFTLWTIVLRRELKECEPKNESKLLTLVNVNDTVLNCVKAIGNFIKEQTCCPSHAMERSIIWLILEITKSILLTSSSSHLMEPSSLDKLQKFTKFLLSSQAKPSSLKNLFTKEQSNRDNFSDLFRASILLLVKLLTISSLKIGNSVNINDNTIKDMLLSEDKNLSSKFKNIEAVLSSASNHCDKEDWDYVDQIKRTIESLWINPTI